MRAVVQRVTKADVTVDGAVCGAIGKGLLVLLGVEDGDGPEDLAFIVKKVLNLRVFDDAEGVMNLSVLDTGGEILAVSQFTLLGNCRKGNRPSYVKAARPEEANRLYQEFTAACREAGVSVAEGIFQAEMLVSLCNDGPVTILMDSRDKK